MNKKFLSAILFGALMVSSTGTFVSCKDYDDDIKDLQEQINSNKDAIAALQKLVGEGKWVTNISSIENGFSVTMSDGTTTSITGIKGADGKNGTEWTIGEDGFWYKDGEKTASQAVAKDGEDGKAGATAPSPKISADGFWVVYEWDAAKGEFVEKTTEISAQGTGAYVVKKDGVYVLHIADETGAFQDVTLPATSDSFVAEAPYSKVRVKYETSIWNKWNANKDDAKTLLKKYPELANIAKDTPMKQGGNLPILVTPANVELTDAFSFALQGVDGKTADIKISNPTKGLPVNTEIDNGWYWFDENGNGQIDQGENRYYGSSMVTRAAENNCFWSVKVDPAYDAKKKKYAEAENSSLSVTNAKGTTVKTAFAYNVECDVISQDVNVWNSNSNVEYAASIDVFAKQGDNAPIFTKNHDYAGYVVLEATNALQIEKYQLSIDGSKLIIGNMPANENAITVALKVTVLGLNGSVKSATADVKIAQSVEVESSLSAKAITLSKDAVEVRWNMSELNMSAIQLDQLMKGQIKFFISRVDADDADKKYVAYNGDVKFYDAKKNEVTYSNGKWYIKNTNTESAATTFGLDIKAATANVKVNQNYEHNKETYVGEMWMPKEYTVEMTSVDGSTVVFSATTTLAVSNPDVTAAYIKLVPAFVENNVFQITGKVDVQNGKVTYKLADGLILNNGTALKGFIDMDNKNYIDNGGDTEDKAAYGNYNWLDGDKEADPNAELSVNVWKTKTPATQDWTAAKWNQLYTERNIRAVYTWFGNDKNIDKFDYKVKVKSEIFSETPAEAIIMDATKLSAVFGGQNKTNIIDIKKAITKALVAAGTDKGKTYELFGSNGSEVTYKVTDYDQPETNGDYVVNASGKPVAISADDLLDLGMTMEQYIEYTALSSKPAIHMTATDKDVTITGVTGDVALKGWGTLQTTFAKYYTVTGKNEIKFNKENASGVTEEKNIPDADKKLIALFNNYKAKIAFSEHNGDKETTGIVAVDSRIAANGVVIAFADALEATKYFQNVAADGVVSGTTITAVDSAPADVTGGKVTVPMQISVTDIWGKTMVRTFDVTVTTK
ncbi:PL29 family lyase N-terminal domain-containing protein [Phocaeicola faecalis]|uniref:PL29 family lyase N-terminal domain-containing protein n=1 Tax=Phocaeicola faecalis TaxID=2786956 RepID=UPI001F18B4EE|nr:PL29 family lyase N-terminal domain-containing protein [Phocaeicola faecalis]